MTTRRVGDPNRGPLSLEHDVTPKDLTRYSYDPSFNDSPRTHRYQGFPGGAFERSRDPMLYDPLSDRKPKATDQATDFNTLEKHYGRAHHFDTAKPKGHQVENTGFMYSSDRPPSKKSQTRPYKNPLQQKTSAELRRFRLEQDMAERDLREFKQRKMELEQMKLEEKKRDLEMLKSYDPFGKEGGGAPLKGGTRKQKFTEEETTPRYANGDDFHANFGKAGSGAPLRTHSGKLKTDLQGDKDIRFQDTKKGRAVVENQVRYHNPPEIQSEYQKELKSQIKSKALQDMEDRIQKQKDEIEMLKHDPYGKPGAGAPNTTRSGTALKLGRNTTLTRDLVEMRRADKQGEQPMETQKGPYKKHFKHYFDDLEGPYEPWGKGSGQPQRDNHGNVRRFKASDPFYGPVTNDDPRSQGKSLELGRGPGGSGAPIRTESGKIKATFANTLLGNERGDNSIKEDIISRVAAPQGQTTPKPGRNTEPLEIYDPFGKGGAGAPIRDSQGKVVTVTAGKLTRAKSPDEARVRQTAHELYLQELRQQQMEQKRREEETKKGLREGAGEFASVIKQGQTGKPRRDPATGYLLDQRLPASDVTRQATNTVRYKTDDSPFYHTSLEEQAEKRKRIMELDKLREKQEANYHHKSMATSWGRPGAGAPNPQGSRKVNLEKILNSPRGELELHAKNTAPKVYLRNTVGSSHTNGYEAVQTQRREPKKEYNLFTPYATVSQAEV